MISVVIPVYNAAQYLHECLDSVVAQEYADWEAICVDDGSTDESGTILDEYAAKDSRFRVIHQANAGVSAARNAALDVARGEWITFIDADDSILPGWLEQTMQIAENLHPDLIRQQTTRSGSNGGIVALEGRAAAEWAWKTLSEFGYVWLCFIRKEVISNLRFSAAITCKEDGIFLMELIPRLHKVCQGAFGGYEYRTIAGSLTKKNRRVVQCVAYLNAYREIWLAQREWVKAMDISELVRYRLRQGADHDVWEWNHQRDRSDKTDPRLIRAAYRELEASGALWPEWCHEKRRLRLPLWIWRKTGCTIGLQALENIESVVRGVRIMLGR